MIANAHTITHIRTYIRTTDKKSTTTAKINGNYLLCNTYMICMCICVLCECLLSALGEDKKKHVRACICVQFISNYGLFQKH